MAMRKLPYLQALRAISASLVVVDHAVLAIASRAPTPQQAFIQFGYFCGFFGVATFFAISGLIMIRTSAGDFGVHGSCWRFGLNRAIRVIPLYWIATLLSFVSKPANEASALLCSLFFIPYVTPGAVVMRPILGQGWTLNLEMMFYVIFAICLLFPRRQGIAALLAIFPLTVIAALAVRPLFPMYDPITRLQFWSDPLILLFSGGILIGLWEMRDGKSHRFARPLRDVSLAFALGSAFFLAFKVTFPLQLPWLLVLGGLCLACVLSSTKTDAGPLSATARCLAMFGDASFSTYLFHPVMIKVLASLLLRTHSILYSTLFVIAAVCAANLMGLTIFFAVEGPLTSTLRRRIMRPLVGERTEVRPTPPAWTG